MKFLGIGLFASSVAGHLLRARVSRRTIRGASSNRQLISPPIAVKHDEIVYFGVNPKDRSEFRGSNPISPPKIRLDPYHWLRDETRQNPKVVSHLQAENDYCAAYMKNLQPLQNKLYEEILSHLKEADDELPFTFGSYRYFSRTVKGLPYRILCRVPLNGGAEQIVLDENEVAAGHEYSSVGANEPSPDHAVLAYAVDHSGNETYSMRFKVVDNNTHLDDVIEECDAAIEWGNDASVVYYLTMDDEHRPNKVLLHAMGTSQDQDVCLFEEDDSMFWVGLSKSASGRFIFIESSSKETSEMHCIDLKGVCGREAHIATSAKLHCIARRQFGTRYSVEHFVSADQHRIDEQDNLLLIANVNNCKNFNLFKVNVSASEDYQNWQAVVSYDARKELQHILPFKNHVVLYGRCDGRESIWVINKYDLTDWKQLEFDEECFSVWIGDNYVYDTDTLRIVFSSFVTPKSIIDVNLDTFSKELMKQQEVPSYDKALYQTRREMYTARDGTQIPCSMVFRKDFSPANGPRPTLLYGYGSYGASEDPTFDFKRICLLDRGVVFVVAHIRGGGEMGRSWYEDFGKYLNKKNTFNDFADCASYLIRSGITTSSQLAAVGRSAGGLLMGVMANEHGNLFKAIIADVPFVDVINTMSDPTIPLTITEWEEWGNPNEAKYHDYMASYSPYDNVAARKYPSMLVTAGLHDPRVAYWEPAKWVAKLRELKTDSNPLLLKTDMSSGHFSASDRYKYIQESAHEYAFILDQICE